MKNKKERIGKIYTLLFMAYTAIIVTPILAAKISTEIQALIIGMLTVITVYYACRNGILKENAGLTIASCLIILQILLYWVLGISTAASGNMYNQIVFYILPLIVLTILRYGSYKEISHISIFLLVVFALNIIDNIRLNLLYPGASVNAVSLEWYPHLRNLNIGTTNFNTMFCLIGIVIFIFYQFDMKKSLKIIMFLLFGSISFYLFCCGLRASAIALYVLGIMSVIIVKKKNYVVFFLMLATILSIIFLLFWDKILISLASFLPERISERIEDIIRVLTYGVDENSFSGRFMLIKVSLDTFSNSVGTFLFGVGDKRIVTTGVSSFIESGIGGHAEFFDILARYGIIGGMLNLSFFISTFRIIKTRLSISFYGRAVYPFFAIFVLAGMIKTIIYPEIGIAFWGGILILEWFYQRATIESC